MLAHNLRAALLMTLAEDETPDETRRRRAHPPSRGEHKEAMRWLTSALFSVACGVGGSIGKAIVQLELETTKYQAELRAAQAQTVARRTHLARRSLSSAVR